MIKENRLAIEKHFAAVLHEQMWIAWREISRAGRRTKIPINAVSGKAASVTRPETWSTYQQAGRYRRQSGIGIVLTRAGSGLYLVGVDLDSCRDARAGTIDAWACDVLAMIASYAEISPSGTGLKIFALMNEIEWEQARTLFGSNINGAPRLGRSWKERGSAHPAGVEIYLGARYFAVTGIAFQDEVISQINASDVRRVIDFAGARFGRSPAAVRNESFALAAGPGDFSESGRAFRACLTAVASGIAMKDIPQWAADQKDPAGMVKYDISQEYWDRPRAEGTQLDRDYARAHALVAKGKGCVSRRNAVVEIPQDWRGSRMDAGLNVRQRREAHRDP